MIRKLFYSAIFFILTSFIRLSAQSSDTLCYLLTCGPGTETYSIYGHSALRVTIPADHFDAIYNWGVFDFSTKNFAWKFAKGRLDYMLIAESPEGFLKEYTLEERYVYSQRINITRAETRKLLILVNENLKPENARYRYDFFYDNCSTRIRDLIENSVGNNLTYPDEETRRLPTFRDMIGKYQSGYPWLNFGIDLLLGSPCDIKAGFRDRMFLPLDMKDGLSESVIRRTEKRIPLLQNPDLLLSYPSPQMKQNFFTGPAFVLSLVVIIILIIAGNTKSRKLIDFLDISIFSVFSLLSALLIFFDFFTDHSQTRWNLNMIWLNPFIIFCLASMLLKQAGHIWFRVVFFVSGLFIISHIILPQHFQFSFILLAFLILVRASVRCGFSWNPLSLKSL